MTDTDQQWIVMHCLNAFKDVDGKPGEHKIPLEGYDTPMTKEQAWKALRRIEEQRPDEDFSIRPVAKVLELKPQ